MNYLTSVLSIEYPILQGGMGNISEPTLAAAVSNAGGLGTIGAGTRSYDEVCTLVTELKQLTAKPFCVNIPLKVNDNARQIAESLPDWGVPSVSLSAGNPAPLIPFFHENGMTVICVVSSVRQAQKAEAAGADMLVAEGFEAAGINASSELTTLTLIPQIAQAVQIPVAAAGGIGSGSGLAAALTLGAQGVQMGTRLIATQEAQVHSAYKEALLAAGEESTVVVGRRYGQIRRLLATPYASKLQEAESANTPISHYMEMVNENSHVRGAVEGKLDKGHTNAGQISSAIHDLPRVSELFQLMLTDARRQLDQAGRMLAVSSSTKND